MKITDAWVDDPAVRLDHTEPPRLCVEVDEYPDVTIAAESFNGGWTVGKDGPFIKYTATTPAADAGVFNMRFHDRFPPVVDISMFLTRGDTHIDTYALNLTRARQLLRKWSNNWRLLLSDKQAQNGRLMWQLREENATCKYIVSERGNPGLCGRPSMQYVKPPESVELPMCSTHVRSVNAQYAGVRSHSTTSR